MKWLKRLLGFGDFTPTPAPTPTSAPADAGSKAFDQMTNTLVALQEKKKEESPQVELPVQEVKEVLPEAVVITAPSEPEVVLTPSEPEVVATPVEEVVQVVDVIVPEPEQEVKPKAPRKPRAKKESITPLPQTVTQNVDQWPFPDTRPAEGEQKPKPAARKAKAK